MPIKPLPKPQRLRWEIGVAMLIKVLLLVGLWWLIFRYMERPVSKPDIATHFALPAAAAQPTSPISSQPVQESHHVR